MIKSKFATVEEVWSKEFEKINKEVALINEQLGLINHTKINKERFSWASKIKDINPFYGSRYWEYPFAILTAELQQGMKCADIGCGTTPFTPYLAKKVGEKNVTGFDPDFVEEESAVRHYGFGARKASVEKAGFNFVKSDMISLNCPDEYFDRVFCISVLEHIINPKVKEKGIEEMVRILKPGGRLILTFDLGIENPLNDPFKLISMSGLIPKKGVDFSWPDKRFVDYGESSMDVFGLVLDKSEKEIDIDVQGKRKIVEYQAYQNNARLSKWFNVEYNDILMIKDLQRPLGLGRFLLKYLMKKYK